MHVAEMLCGIGFDAWEERRPVSRTLWSRVIRAESAVLPSAQSRQRRMAPGDRQAHECGSLARDPSALRTTAVGADHCSDHDDQRTGQAAPSASPFKRGQNQHRPARRRDLATCSAVGPSSPRVHTWCAVHRWLRLGRRFVSVVEPALERPRVVHPTPVRPMGGLQHWWRYRQPEGFSSPAESGRSPTPYPVAEHR